MNFIVANWKQHKTSVEGKSWLEGFESANVKLPIETNIVLTGSYTLLPTLEAEVKERNLPLFVGAQNVSPMAEGAYTGEVGARQLKEFADYVIIGHSERRMYFGETNQFVALKVKQALANQLTPFVCIADQVYEDGRVPREKIDVKESWFANQIEVVLNDLQETQAKSVVFVYEPISAISTFGGEPLTTKQAVGAVERIKKIAQYELKVMYGGSVNAENVLDYWGRGDIKGVMPGNASLEIQEFLKIVFAIEKSKK